jgi:sarcosine oxidase
MTAWDVIVVGVGGMGSATVFELAQRGLRVLGLERFDVPHEFGSSHGVTRIIRLGYWEHPAYVPLLHRAFDRWRDIEFLAGERLLITTGSIDAGSESSATFAGSRRACEQHDLPHAVYDGRELNARFPGYNLPADMFAVFQAKGGFVMSERAIVAYVWQALGRGAEIHAREQVLEWKVKAGGVDVRTDRSEYRAGRLVLTAGAWNGTLDTTLSPLLVAERQVLLWTQPLQPRDFAVDTFPVFNMEVPEGRFYGLPEHYIPGFKIGRYHHRHERVDPDAVRRPPDAADEAVLRQAIARYFPGADGPVMSMRTCLFTNSPDEHFIIGPHPDEPRVVVAAGFSGHGFKFCSVVGEILADLAMGIAPAFDIGFLSPLRFTGRRGAQP